MRRCCPRVCSRFLEGHSTTDGIVEVPSAAETASQARKATTFDTIISTFDIETTTSSGERTTAFINAKTSASHTANHTGESVIQTSVASTGESVTTTGEGATDERVIPTGGATLGPNTTSSTGQTAQRLVSIRSGIPSSTSQSTSPTAKASATAATTPIDIASTAKTLPVLRKLH